MFLYMLKLIVKSFPPYYEVTRGGNTRQTIDRVGSRKINFAPHSLPITTTSEIFPPHRIPSHPPSESLGRTRLVYQLLLCRVHSFHPGYDIRHLSAHCHHPNHPHFPPWHRALSLHANTPNMNPRLQASGLTLRKTSTSTLKSSGSPCTSSLISPSRCTTKWCWCISPTHIP